MASGSDWKFNPNIAGQGVSEQITGCFLQRGKNNKSDSFEYNVN